MEVTAERAVFVYDSAVKIAEKYLELLAPHCERIEIAGSLRRKNSIVHDIEFVCIPKRVSVRDGLFDTKFVTTAQFREAVEKLERVKGDPWGKYTKRMTEEGISIDLFMCRPDNWGFIMAIRTGPARFSKDLMKIAKRKGFTMHGGDVYSFQGDKFDLPEERDFFRILGVPWEKPEFRL